MRPLAVDYGTGHVCRPMSNRRFKFTLESIRTDGKWAVRIEQLFTAESRNAA